MAQSCSPCRHAPSSSSLNPAALQSIAARYGVLKRDAGIALRGLYIITPEVGPADIQRTPLRRAAWCLLTMRRQLHALWHLVGSSHVLTASVYLPSQGVIEHITMNNFPIGRNVDEAKRTLQAGCVAGVNGQMLSGNIPMWPVTPE